MLFGMLDEYLTYLELKNCSKYTLRNYRFMLKRFFVFYHGKLEDINLVEVFRFMCYLKEIGLSFNYRQSHLIAIRSFLKYCLLHDIPTLHYGKLEVVKKEYTETVFLERAEMEKLFQITHEKKLLSLRNTAIFRLLYSTGCRVSELANLNRDQVGKDEVSILGKGQKWRIVFISPEASKAVRDYLDFRKDKYKPLFISHGRGGNRKDRRISVTMIQKMVRTYGRQAGLYKRITPHRMRHTFATHLLRNGAPLPAIQQLLGHSSLATTQMYLHCTDPYLKSVFQENHR